MSPLTTFCWGFAGSVAVEVVALLGYYYADPVRLPSRYRKPGFWLTRLVLALLGGALAVGYGIEQAVLAFNIGAATPLIITSLARGIRPPGIPQRLLGQGRDADRGRGEMPGESDPSPRSQQRSTRGTRT